MFHQFPNATPSTLLSGSVHSDENKYLLITEILAGVHESVCSTGEYPLSELLHNVTFDHEFFTVW